MRHKNSFIAKKDRIDYTETMSDHEKVMFYEAIWNYQLWNDVWDVSFLWIAWNKLKKEMDESNWNYEKICKQNSKKWKKHVWNQYTEWDEKRKGNDEAQKNAVEQMEQMEQMEHDSDSDSDSDSENKKEEKDKSFSKKRIPTPSELVEAYRNTPQLVEKIKDEWVVKQRAEYKQKKKSKAYKTISWFIQQLVENVTTVSNWEIRYDVWERLRYAQNKAIDWDNLWIRRDERMERWFATWKKFNSLTQKQNE